MPATGITKNCLILIFATAVALAMATPSVSPATNGGDAGVPQTFWTGWAWAGDVVGVGQSGYHLATGQFSAMDLLGFAPSVGWAMGAYRGVRGFSRGVVAPNNVPQQIKSLGDDISRWLGKDAKAITNEAGDTIIQSADGLREIRFDFNHTYPHKNPHTHLIEYKMVKNKKVEITNRRIYPSGVTPE